MLWEIVENREHGGGEGVPLYFTTADEASKKYIERRGSYS
jgi:hypothetical protein